MMLRSAGFQLGKASKSAPARRRPARGLFCGFPGENPTEIRPARKTPFRPGSIIAQHKVRVHREPFRPSDGHVHDARARVQRYQRRQPCRQPSRLPGHGCTLGGNFIFVKGRKSVILGGLGGPGGPPRSPKRPIPDPWKIFNFFVAVICGF